MKQDAVQTFVLWRLGEKVIIGGVGKVGKGVRVKDKTRGDEGERGDEEEGEECDGE